MFFESLMTIIMNHGFFGKTSFSVEPAAYCMKAFPPANCATPTTWSSFYNGYVHQERFETAEKRMSVGVRALIEASESLVCQTADGANIDKCTPYPGVIKGKRRRFNVLTIASLGLGVAQLESGFREDVQMGRGWAKQPSDDGGRGRGLGGEACFMQPHPSISWRFADISEDLRERAASGDKDAREEVQQSLLGSDVDSLRRCWLVGLRMLIHSRAYCDWWLWDMKRRTDINWKSPEYHWDYMTISMYGTGTSCSDSNRGKTPARVSMFRTFYSELKGKK